MGRKNEYIAEIDKIIGGNIRVLRLARGYSRDALAKKIDVTHQQLRKYEKGFNRVTVGRVLLISKALETTLEVLLNGTRKEDPEKFVTTHQRQCMEVARNFMQINNPAHQNAIHILAKTLANNK